MRLGLLGCAAALTLIGASAAQAETIYVEPGYAEPTYPGYAQPAYVEPGYVAAPSGYVYTEQTPFAGPRYVITERPAVVVAEPAAPMVVTAPAPTVIAEPAAPVELAPPVEVVRRPLAVAPRDRIVERRVLPRRSGIVTTGYSASHSCFIDRNGFERCY